MELGSSRDRETENDWTEHETFFDTYWKDGASIFQNENQSLDYYYRVVLQTSQLQICKRNFLGFFFCFLFLKIVKIEI